MWSSGDVIKALEAVRELVGEGRRIAREAAEKSATRAPSSEVFGGSANPSATAALDRTGQAAGQIGEADGFAAAALEDIGAYIEVVKGNGPGGGGGSGPPPGLGGSTSAGGDGYDAEGTWRKLPAFPPKPPRHTYGSATGTDGETVSVVSGEKTPDGKAHDWRYVEGVNLARRLGLVPAKGKPNVASDVELKWALQMRRDGITDSQVTINHPDGPCRGAMSCNQLLPI